MVVMDCVQRGRASGRAALTPDDRLIDDLTNSLPSPSPPPPRAMGEGEGGGGKKLPRETADVDLKTRAGVRLHKFYRAAGEKKNGTMVE